jgi:hypothetical protein
VVENGAEPSLPRIVFAMASCANTRSRFAQNQQVDHETDKTVETGHVPILAALR